MSESKYRSVIVRVDSLQHWAKNPRIITEEHVERLVSMMRSHKGLEPLIVEEDGTVLGGNARLIALRKIGETEAWAIVVHPENDKERVEIALQDNDHVGITDKEKLMPLVSSLSPDALGKYSVSFDEGIDLASVMTKFGPSDDVDPFEGQNIEKIVIIMDPQQYEACLDGLAVVMEKQGLEGDHSLAIINLLKEYAADC